MDVRTRLSSEKIEYKEEEGEFYTEGFVATDHPDKVGDVLSKGALSKIVESINNKAAPMAGTASYRHDWIKQDNPDLPPVGRAVAAELRKTSDGHLGAWVKTHHNKYHPDFEKTKYEVVNGYLPGYSIEFDKAKRTPVSVAGKEFNNVEDLEIVGYGLANSRMIANPNARIEGFGYKEIERFAFPVEKTEHVSEVVEVAENKEVEQKKAEEAKAEDAPKEPEQKEVTEAKESGFSVSKEDYELLAQMKEQKEKDAYKNQIAAEVKEALSKIVPQKAPFVGGNQEKTEMKELTSYKEAISEAKELDKPVSDWKLRASIHSNIVNMQYKEAARLTNALIAGGVDVKMPANGESKAHYFKEAPEYGESLGTRMEVKEFKEIEMKTAGLQTDTNKADASWTYGSYYQSPVELNDIYGPVVVNQLNDMTTTWGRLEKVNFSGRSQIQFRARTGRNSTAGGYSEGANLAYGTDFTGTVGRQKFQQPFAYYRVLVAVTGQEMQLSRSPGGMGDIWADEIKWSTVDLLKKLNQDVLGTGDGTSESACLGFEGLILGTSGTLYGKSLSTYTTLKSHKKNASSKAVSLALIRQYIRYCKTGDGTVTNSNARQQDLVIFTSPLQVDKVRAIYQTMMRIAPTSGRVGFEGMLEIDGVPFFEDPDINDDDLFVVDTAHTKIGVNFGPVLEQLPVTADAKAAHVKIYFNLYSDAPSNNAWIHTLDTTEAA